MVFVWGLVAKHERSQGWRHAVVLQRQCELTGLRSIATRVATRSEGLFVGCLTTQQHASVSQGRIFSDSFMCCHIEIEVADQTFHLTQSQYTDTGPTNPSTDPKTPGAWQDSHWIANF